MHLLEKWHSYCFIWFSFFFFLHFSVWFFIRQYKIGVNQNYYNVSKCLSWFYWRSNCNTGKKRPTVQSTIFGNEFRILTKTLICMSVLSLALKLKNIYFQMWLISRRSYSFHFHFFFIHLPIQLNIHCNEKKKKDSPQNTAIYFDESLTSCLFIFFLSLSNH